MSIRTLAHSIDLKENPNEEHSERVAGLVRRLAEAAEWPTVRIAQLVEAARIHDVGKIGVPDDVLLKPASLTAAEFELIKPHAALGAQMAREALGEEQAMWIEQHHERFDGAGYPNGLSGAQISEGAGLLALADSWAVMTSVRSYSPAKPEAAGARRVSLACRQPVHTESLQGSRRDRLASALAPHQQQVALDDRFGDVVELAAGALRLLAHELEGALLVDLLP